MIKTDLQAYFVTKWGNITSPKRLPVIDREVANAMLDNCYGDVISETQSTPINTTPANASTLKYDINYIKQGRAVTITGFITNMTGSTSSSNAYFNFNAGEFATDSDFIFTGFANTDSRPIKMIMLAGNISTASAVANNEVVNFSLTYFTNN